MNELVKNYLFSIECDGIDNNLLFDDLLEFEKKLKSEFTVSDIKNYGSFTTSLYNRYNLLSLHTKEINKLGNCLRKYIKPILPSDYYFIQVWFNVFRRGEFIDWHSHWHSKFNVFHGYYCVNAINSTTTYLVPPDVKCVIDNKNGLLVFGKSDGDKHKSSKWFSDTPRVTIAFDIIPIEILQGQNLYNQHYIIF